MLERVRENLKRGLSRINWFATVFAERIKIEIAVVKLMYRSNEMEEERDALFRSIGRRVYELKGNSEKNIFRDRAVVEAIDGIENLDRNIEDLKQKVDEMSRAGT